MLHGALVLAAALAPQDPSPAGAARDVLAALEGPYEHAVLGGDAAAIPADASTPTASAFVALGLALLHAGDVFEADRAFREATWRDATQAVAWCGLALCNEHRPALAARHALAAHQLRDQLSERDRALVDACADYLGGSRAAEPGDVAPAPPSGAARERFAADLLGIARRHPDDVEILALAIRARVEPVPMARAQAEVRADLDSLLEVAPQHPARRYRTAIAEPATLEEAIDLANACARAAPGVSAMWAAGGRLLEGRDPARSASMYEAALRTDHAGMAARHRFPYETPGYAERAARLGAQFLAAGQVDRAATLADYLLWLPRHPRLDDGSPRIGERLRGLVDHAAVAANGALPAHDEVAALAAPGDAGWRPQRAPGFELPAHDGNTLGLSGFAGRPVLVVFFLGFGCVHCVDQLNQLAPRKADFDSRGIAIVTIGTDTLDAVKASFLQAIEGDQDPLPFPVLADPQGATFARWQCWDDFRGAPLHGTFLVDRDGFVRWRDISLEPFLATDFLLEECSRLLAQPANGG